MINSRKILKELVDILMVRGIIPKEHKKPKKYIDVNKHILVRENFFYKDTRVMYYTEVDIFGQMKDITRLDWILPNGHFRSYTARWEDIKDVYFGKIIKPK